MLHTRVRATPHAADDPLAHAIAHDLAARIDLHHAALHESVFVGQQRAHPARERVRQHRHRAVREVHARPAHTRLGVQRGLRCTYQLTSAMCTCNSVLPFSSGRTSTASSKSLAVSPSMVTIGSPRKSSRRATPPRRREQPLSFARSCASAITFVGNVCGRWCLRMTISTSTPNASGGPSTSMIRPSAGLPCAGNCVSSTSTARPLERPARVLRLPLRALRPSLFAEHAMLRLQSPPRQPPLPRESRSTPQPARQTDGRSSPAARSGRNPDSHGRRACRVGDPGCLA